MRVYELIFILKPDLPEEESNATIEQIKGVITDGGQIDKLEVWGKRRLAYAVKRYTDGFYVFVQYSTEGGAQLSKEIERRLRVSDSVMKFMTIRIDQELKRLEKFKQRREKRAARKPPPAAPAPAEPKSRSESDSEAPKVPQQPVSGND